MAVEINNRKKTDTISFAKIPVFAVFQSRLREFEDSVYLKVNSKAYIGIMFGSPQYVEAANAHERFLSSLYLSDQQVTFFNK